MSNAPLLTFIGVVVGALGAYLAAARRLSGKVTTSDAAQLWAESRAIRQELEDRNRYLVSRLDALETKYDELQRENARLLRLINGKEAKHV